jgi:hypothetical protein
VKRTRFVGHELQSLMASQDRELFVGAHWERDSVPRSPVNRRIDGTGDGEHRGRDVDTDDSCVGPKPFAHHARHNTGATGNVDDDVAASRSNARNQLRSERPEQRSDQNTLVDFCERCRY